MSDLKKENKRGFTWFGILMIVTGVLTGFGIFLPILLVNVAIIWHLIVQFGYSLLIVFIFGIIVLVNKKLKEKTEAPNYIHYYNSLLYTFFAKLTVIVSVFISGVYLYVIAIEFIIEKGVGDPLRFLIGLVGFSIVIIIILILVAFIAVILEMRTWFQFFTFIKRVRNYPKFLRLIGIIGTLLLFFGNITFFISSVISDYWSLDVLWLYIGAIPYIAGYLVIGDSMIFIPDSVLEEIRLIDESERKHPERILEVKNLTKVYSSGIIKVSKVVGARNVNFTIKRGEILSIVGESGSGKSTVANVILRLIDATEGEVLLDDKPIENYTTNGFYRRVQAIFQDPYGSFNLFYKIDRALENGFKLRGEKISKSEKEKEIHDVLKKIGLNPHEVLGRYPHQLSGGQLQRFLLARVLIVKPELLIADEMTSMIDASSRAGILNLLEKLRVEEQMSVIFITHDIGQAQYISDNVIVMEKGDVVEKGPVTDVLSNPQHRYTKQLLSAVPTMNTRWDFLKSLSKK